LYFVFVPSPLLVTTVQNRAQGIQSSIMSRWLSSVNHLLEKLDDQAEQVGDKTETTARSAAALASSLFSRQEYQGSSENSSSDDDDDDDEQDEDSYLDSAEEDEYEEEEDEEEEEPEINLAANPNPDSSKRSEPLFDDDRVDAAIAEISPASVSKEAAAAVFERTAGGTSRSVNVPQETTPPLEITTRKVPPPPPPPTPRVAEAPKPPPLAPAPAPPAAYDKANDSQPPSASGSVSSSTAAGSQQQQQQQHSHKQRAHRDVKKAHPDGSKLLKLNHALQLSLDAARVELDAQQDELARAAVRMEHDRTQAVEEREDLLDDHDEQVQQLTSSYETKLKEQREEYQEQLVQLQTRVQQEEQQRRQEGGDWTQELQDALERERDALKRIVELQSTQTTLESSKTKLGLQQQALQTTVESLQAANQTASDLQRETEDKLDAAASAHKHQLGQRQTREGELERTVAELGAALTLARDASSRNKARASIGEETAEVSYKDQYEVAAEELETVQTQLSLVTQRSEALQQELRDISNERLAEAAAVQERQRQHDGTVATLSTKVSQLEASLRELKQDDDHVGPSTEAAAAVGPSSDSDRVRQLRRELDRSKRQITSFSDQLIRQQGSTETAKSEILALKGRLQASNTRADAAEQVHASSANSDEKMYELEGGGVTYTASKLRRRVKSGRGRSHLPSRSVRSALGMRLANGGSGMDQVALTIDAVDSWMLETGTILRLEPLARLGFALYLTILHLWCLTLVFFHAIESEHGDLGALRTHPMDAAVHSP